MQQLFDANAILSHEDLCIENSDARFRIDLSVAVLDADGAVFDASLLSCVEVLKRLELPVVEIHKDGRAEIADLDEGKALALNSEPVALTIGCFNEMLVVDPIDEEESFMDATMTFIVDEHGNILSMPVHMSRLL